MIVGAVVEDVKFSNISEGKSFNIKNSPKAFQILSSGLYANKIKAIIRELSCNAVDSHTAAGNSDVPFDVHLPTKLEPHFSVRDYGTGLSHEDIETIYTTYFESTKTGSNDFIGALGLGSKSPFSYTNNFTVTSYMDGVENIYTSYISADGLPAITRLANLQTEEPNGLLVSIAVDGDDFYKFNHEAAEVFAAFKLHPNVSGNYNRKLVSLDNLMDGVDIDLLSSSYGTMSARMGNIIYPVTVPNANNVMPEYYHLYSSNIIVEFGIGELDIAASREGLSYIPSTIQAIKDRLQKIHENMPAIIDAKIKAETNVWQQAATIRTMCSSRVYSVYTGEWLAKNKQPFCNARSVDSQYILNVSTLEKYNIRMFGRTAHYKRGNIEYERRIDTNKQLYDIIRISTNLTTTFIANPDNKKIAGRKQVWMKSQPSYTEIFECVPLDDSKPMQFDDLMKELFEPRVITIDELPELEKKISSTTRTKTSGVLVSNNPMTSYSNKWETFSMFVNDPEKTYYYVPVKSSKVITELYEYPMGVDDYIDMFKYCGFNDQLNMHLWGLNKTALKEIQDLPNWIKFEDYVKECINKFISASDINLQIRRQHMTRNYSQLFPLLDDNSEFKKFYNIQNIMGSINTNTITKLYQKLGIDYNIEEAMNNASKEIENMENKYPLVDQTAAYYKTEAVVQYINLIEGR